MVSHVWVSGGRPLTGEEGCNNGRVFAYSCEKDGFVFGLWLDGSPCLMRLGSPYGCAN